MGATTIFSGQIAVLIEAAVVWRRCVRVETQNPMENDGGVSQLRCMEGGGEAGPRLLKRKNVKRTRSVLTIYPRLWGLRAAEDNERRGSETARHPNASV